MKYGLLEGYQQHLKTLNLAFVYLILDPAQRWHVNAFSYLSENRDSDTE